MLYGYFRCVVFTLIVLHTFFDCFVAVLFCLVDSVLLALVGCFGLVRMGCLFSGCVFLLLLVLWVGGVWILVLLIIALLVIVL